MLCRYLKVRRLACEFKVLAVKRIDFLSRLLGISDLCKLFSLAIFYESHMKL